MRTAQATQVEPTVKKTLTKQTMLQTMFLQ